MVLRRQPVPVLRAPVLGVVLFLTVVATYAETSVPYDPRCIDRVNISVDDQTGGVFFSEYTQKKLRKYLRDIHTITDLQIQRVKKAIEQCEDNAKMGWCDDQKIVMSETKFLVRTVWKGGIRDLWFTSASEKVADTAGPAVKLILGYSVNGGPQLEVAGDTCQYRSPADVTMLASFPEKTSGAKQNFHDLASFVSHQLITLSETTGCNLGSDAKSVVIKVAANGKTKPLPGRVEFLTYEASAMKSSRHERSSLAAVDKALAASGQTTIEIFNRPTNVRYRLAHPRDFGDWLDVHEQRVADDYVCGVFSPKVKVGPAPVFDLPLERLDKASINLQIDGGHAFLQDYPNFAFRIHWYSPGRIPVLITQSTDFVQLSPFQKVSEVEIRGQDLDLLPGQYLVVLEWKRDARRPITEKREFLWHSSAGFNVADAFGLLGPRRIKKLYKSGSKNSNRIMRSYFFEQALTGRFIKWEQWRNDGGARMARGILWHFREMNTLPYLSQFSGVEGTVAELVRALSVALADSDKEIGADEETAIDFLSRFDHAPSIFNKSVYLRRAMCRVQDALETRGDAIEWMQCQ